MVNVFNNSLTIAMPGALIKQGASWIEAPPFSYTHQAGRLPAGFSSRFERVQEGIFVRLISEDVGPQLTPLGPVVARSALQAPIGPRPLSCAEPTFKSDGPLFTQFRRLYLTERSCGRSREKVLIWDPGCLKTRHRI